MSGWCGLCVALGRRFGEKSLLTSNPALPGSSESFWVNNSPDEDVPQAPPLEEFKPFDPIAYEELREAPASYYDYLRRQLEWGDVHFSSRRFHTSLFPVPWRSGAWRWCEPTLPLAHQGTRFTQPSDPPEAVQPGEGALAG